MPVPVPAPAGTSVAACYDLAPAEGKTINLVYRSTEFDLDGQPTIYVAPPEEQVVGGLVDFQGHMAIETRSSFTGTPPHTNKSYTRQTGPAELTEYGSLGELVTNTVQSSSVTVYTPPLVTSFTAMPGQSMTLSATWVTTNTVNGVAQPPITMSATTTGTFIGFEPVTIPAGTFNACRFEQKHSGPQGPTSTRWLLLGHGVELKSSTPPSGGSGAQLLELTLLLINGVVPQ